jgi:hypothetical protein
VGGKGSRKADGGTEKEKQWRRKTKSQSEKIGEDWIEVGRERGIKKRKQVHRMKITQQKNRGK